MNLNTVENVVLLSVGREEPDVSPGTRHIYLGTIEDDDRLSEIYCAADIFVIPSIQDNLPNTAIESIACGTPVVGTEVGGIPDIVSLAGGVPGIFYPSGGYPPGALPHGKTIGHGL